MDYSYSVSLSASKIHRISGILQIDGWTSLVSSTFTSYFVLTRKGFIYLWIGIYMIRYQDWHYWHGILRFRLDDDIMIARVWI